MLGSGCAGSRVQRAQFPKGLNSQEVDQLIALVRPLLDDDGQSTLNPTVFEVVTKSCGGANCSHGADLRLMVNVTWEGSSTVHPLAELERKDGIWQTVQRFKKHGAGALIGMVIDASTDAPLGEAVVTTLSPALGGEQMLLADSKGHYRAFPLPSGVYMLRVEMEGYKPYVREGISVRADATFRVDAPLERDASQGVSGLRRLPSVGTPAHVDRRP